MAKVGPKEAQLRALRDRQMARGGAWGWARREEARDAVAAVRPAVQDRVVRQIEGPKDMPMEVETEVERDGGGSKKLQVRVTLADLEKIERARGKMPMSEFLRAAALYVADHVDLLTIDR